MNLRTLYQKTVFFRTTFVYYIKSTYNELILSVFADAYSTLSPTSIMEFFMQKLTDKPLKSFAKGSIIDDWVPKILLIDAYEAS